MRDKKWVYSSTPSYPRHWI